MIQSKRVGVNEEAPAASCDVSASTNETLAMTGAWQVVEVGAMKERDLEAAMTF